MKRLLIFCMGCLIATSSLAMHCGDEDEEEAAIQFIRNATAKDFDRVLAINKAEAEMAGNPLPPEINEFLALPMEQQNNILDRVLAELGEAGPSTSGAVVGGAGVEPAGAMANVELPQPVPEEEAIPWPQGKFNELRGDAEHEFFQKTQDNLYFDKNTPRILTRREYAMLYGETNLGPGLQKPGYTLHKVTKYAAENGHRLRDIKLYYTQKDFGRELGYIGDANPFNSELGKWARGYW